MNVWAIVNQKGGVGKTTTTAALAAELAQRGHRVLCLDIDPSASLAHYFKIDADQLDSSLVTLFGGETDNLQDLIIQTPWDNVSVATGGSGLATLDRQGRQGLGRVLSAALQGIQAQFDYVLIDCPPTLGVLTINALAASDRLLIPTQTEFLALKGLKGMLNTRGMVEKARKSALPAVIIPTLFDGRTRACKQALAELRNEYGDMVSRLEIPIDTKVREASALGETLSKHAPEARATQAYSNLINELTMPGTGIPQEVAV